MVTLALVTVKEWLMEPRDTANSDEDTEHISGWSLFFQCRCNGSAKVVLIIMQIELDARAVSNDDIGPSSPHHYCSVQEDRVLAGGWSVSAQESAGSCALCRSHHVG